MTPLLWHQSRVWLVLRLRSMNPIGLGPLAIFQKEVRASGRRSLTYWGRGLYALGLSGIVGLVFLGFLSSGLSGQGAAGMQQMQEAAPAIAMGVLWFQFCGLIFAGPLLTGPSLCDERRNRTLSALLTTPLTAGEIVAGKLIGQLSQLVILALVPLPVLLGVRIFGGLDAEVVIAGTMVALSSAVLASSWALAASLHSPRGVTAAAIAWVTMLFLHGLVPMIAMVRGGTIAGMTLPSWLQSAVCPPRAMSMISFELMGAGRVASIWSEVLASVAGSLAISTLLWLFTVARLRAVLTRTGGEFEVPRLLWKRKKSPASEPEASTSAAGEPATGSSRRSGRRSSRDESRVVGAHPVVWREVRQSAFRSRGRLYLHLGCAGLILAFIYLVGDITDRELHAVVGILGSVLFALVASIATTSSIGAERESRTWPLLLATPLSARAIVWGKFAGGLARLWLVPAALLVHFAVVAPIGGFVSPVQVFFLLGNLVCTAVFLCATGVFWSMCIRRVTLASVANLGLAMGLWLLLPLVTTFTCEVILNGRVSDPTGYLFSSDPVALAISAAAEFGATDDGLSEMRYQVADLRYTGTEFASICTSVWMAYGLASVGILTYTSRLLAARRDRLA